MCRLRFRSFRSTTKPFRWACSNEPKTLGKKGARSLQLVGAQKSVHPPDCAHAKNRLKSREESCAMHGLLHAEREGVAFCVCVCVSYSLAGSADSYAAIWRRERRAEHPRRPVCGIFRRGTTGIRRVFAKRGGTRAEPSGCKLRDSSQRATISKTRVLWLPQCPGTFGLIQLRFCCTKSAWCSRSV